MKHLLIIALSMALCGALHAQNIEKFLGAWDFDTETGAVGYETGIMTVSKDAVITTFTDISYEYPSTSFTVEGDTKARFSVTC